MSSSSTSNKPALNIGVLLDDTFLPAWAYAMLERILAEGNAHIKLLIINKTPAPNLPDSLLEKFRYHKLRSVSLAVHRMADSIYTRWIEGEPQLANANALVPAFPLLSGIPVLHVTPRQTRHSDYFPTEAIASIQARNLDLLIRLGFRILRGDILTATRYGIWSYHHGDNQVNRGGPPGFWESMEGWPTTGSTLLILTEELDNGKVLCRSWSTTHVDSIKDNCSNNYWTSLSLLPRKLKELREQGPEHFLKQHAQQWAHPKFYSKPLYRVPNARESLYLVLRKFLSKIKRSLTYRLYFDQWILLFDLRDAFSSSFWRYRRLCPPKDRFWADPFVIQEQDRYYLFLEEFPFARNKGHISVIEMDSEGNTTPAVKILERPYHLSYPFIFTYDGVRYMIPETHQNRSIELYKCTQFPHHWEFQHTLMDNVRAVDATLLQHDGRWWMFVSMAENDHASLTDELHLFYADSPLATRWQPHPCNPIVSDCRNARPAGAIFEHAGQLYRPAQNAEGHYGHGINLNLIETLNTQSYHEITVSQAMPDWHKRLSSLHTFNRDGRLHVIDAQLRRFRFGR